MNAEYLLRVLSGRAAALRSGDLKSVYEYVRDIGEVAFAGESKPVKERAAAEYAKSCGYQIEALYAHVELLSAIVGMLAAKAEGDSVEEARHVETIQDFLTVDYIEPGVRDPMLAVRAQIAHDALASAAA